jgi:hypothetical protein
MREGRSDPHESRIALAEIARPKPPAAASRFGLPCGSIAFIRFSLMLSLRRVEAGENSAGGNDDFSYRDH